MTEEAVCVGIDVARSALDVSVTDSGEARQFANNDEVISMGITRPGQNQRMPPYPFARR